MLEIILLVYLCTKIGGILRDEKGWENAFWMQLAMILIYFLSMFLGGVCYGIFVAITQGESGLESLGWSPYLAGYIGVLIGVGTFFMYIKSLPVKQSVELLQTESVEPIES